MTTRTPPSEPYGLPMLVHASRRLLQLLVCALTIMATTTQANPSLTLKLGGSPDAIAYARLLLGSALAADGHPVTIEEAANQGHIPMTRLEVMLKQGDISVLILGRTADRDHKFLSVPVGMTDNLVNQRILFIPKGSQPDYDPVLSLEDFRQLGKVAAIGDAWADRAIWQSNDLPFATISGDWRRLYWMVASATRPVDYLSRGAQEMSEEWNLHTELDVERNLVFVHGQDHILYVSPTQPELHRLLHEAILKARDTGLIRQLARKHYAKVFEPPVNLQDRRTIPLRPAAQ